MRVLLNADAVYLSTDPAGSTFDDFFFINVMPPDCAHTCTQVSVYSIHLPRSHLVKVQHRPSFKNSCSLIKADELVGQGGEAR